MNTPTQPPRPAQRLSVEQEGQGHLIAVGSSSQGPDWSRQETGGVSGGSQTLRWGLAASVVHGPCKQSCPSSTTQRSGRVCCAVTLGTISRLWRGKGQSVQGKGEEGRRC